MVKAVPIATRSRETRPHLHTKCVNEQRQTEILCKAQSLLVDGEPDVTHQNADEKHKGHT